jgi:hypothetical protein
MRHPTTGGSEKIIEYLLVPCYEKIRGATVTGEQCGSQIRSVNCALALSLALPRLSSIIGEGVANLNTS